MESEAKLPYVLYYDEPNRPTATLLAHSVAAKTEQKAIRLAESWLQFRKANEGQLYLAKVEHGGPVITFVKSVKPPA